MPVLATVVVRRRMLEEMDEHKTLRFEQISTVVLAVLKARVRACVSKAVAWAKRTIREALRPAPVVGGLLCDVFRSRSQLLAENALLRQQLLVASRSKKRPAFRPLERGLLVFLSSITRRWRDALLLVKPDTIIGWHREGFRLKCFRSLPAPLG